MGSMWPHSCMSRLGPALQRERVGFRYPRITNGHKSRARLRPKKTVRDDVRVRFSAPNGNEPTRFQGCRLRPRTPTYQGIKRGSLALEFVSERANDCLKSLPLLSCEGKNNATKWTFTVQ